MLPAVPPSPPPPPPTVVRVVIVRRLTLPSHGVRARFRLALKRPTLASAVNDADGFLARAKALAKRAHLRFRVRTYRSFAREIFVPGSPPPPPRTVYEVAARFDLGGPSPRAAAPLVGRLSRHAFLLSFRTVSGLDPAARRKLWRRLGDEALVRARRLAVHDCRLLGDRGARIHRVVMSRGEMRPLPPRPILNRVLAARIASAPPPVTSRRRTLTVRASLSVWCYPNAVSSRP
jgi:hypothetical protein